MLRLATFSTLYPNAANPAHGVFVEERLRHLVDTGRVQARVIAPVPWFPLRGRRFGKYGQFARAPRFERRHGIEVHHPRYLLPPAVGMSVAPWSLALTGLRALQRMRAEGFHFDAIDAHYFYPDGVAAEWLARQLGVPCVITARGSDVTLLPRYPGPRRRILGAARRAAAIITVCDALKQDLVRLGADAERITVLRNGVDLARFRPVDRTATRAALGWSGTMLLSVGWLIDRKRHDLAIKALEELPHCRLAIVGTGPLEASLQALVRARGLTYRVSFVGHVPQAELPRYYSAADALLLCSTREGWANVLLEAMACGTPVAATDVGGTNEVVRAPEAGTLIAQHTPDAVASAVRALLQTAPCREATRRYAERFGWHDTTLGQLRLFERALAVTGVRGAAPSAT
jgi:teichuronic acid biosynthesis glycosyltransferase TuaC